MNNWITPWFHDRVASGMLLGAGAFLFIAWGIVTALRMLHFVGPEMGRELHARCRSWFILYLIMGGILVAGRIPIIAGFCVLGILCHREFARATGFFRDRVMSAMVVLGIIAIFLAAADNWYGFFVALPSLIISAMLIVALIADSPSGFIQRVGLGIFSFMLFGVCLGHMAYFANDVRYRALLLLIVICVELNDVFAFCVGKWIGGKKIAPHTSPGKTVAGSVGALVLTTLLFICLGHFVFRNTVIGGVSCLITMGLMLSFAGQMGDLIISSVKRDLGVKDMGVIIPGHGGMLDRFDSLLFVGPALFHFIGYFLGIGLDLPARIWF